MPGIASNRVAPPLYQRQSKLRPRSEAKRSRIVEAATQHFAEHGYHAARVGDIATALGIAKGSIFQHFGSKDGLFFEVYKRAVRSFSKYLDVPPEVREGECGEDDSRGNWTYPPIPRRVHPCLHLLAGCIHIGSAFFQRSGRPAGPTSGLCPLTAARTRGYRQDS